ncbi:major facilitator transporter [Pokkaliibacter plantistimulans]|uniref:Major facilitator transporter n=1 Tax=Pokkaliibacter plantistimulans TaxID=1635171 RepID=A0ABX5LVZ6_9GAMM|nr:MFS transporter [Pokkaliibacter plantistimulans]PXF30829.1 major facilitator transporter [Pokkaliibacter plantistimulans]
MALASLTGVIPPLFSLVIFTLGHGLLTTLLTLRLSAEHVDPQAIGMVSAAYFAGLFTGSFFNARIIVRVGHIRAYAAYASILATLAILHGLLIDPAIWTGLRFIGGIATSGLFVVIESWMLVSSSPQTRGQILAFYMILLYGALAVAQLLLKYIDPMILVPFAMTAMAASLSVVPLSLTRVASPTLEITQGISFFKLVKLTPSGAFGSFTSGMVLGSIYGLMPLFFTDTGHSLNQVANLMAVLILGGMTLQYPVGRLSDKMDRRVVLTILCCCLTIASLTLVFGTEKGSYYIQAGLIFLFGGLAFSLYPMSLSHACDELAPDQVISANQGLLLSYSIGAVIGPLLAPVAMSVYGPKGLFIYFCIVSGVLAGFLLWRKKVRAPVPLAEHQNFITVPPNSPVTAELDPRADVNQTDIEAGEEHWPTGH